MATTRAKGGSNIAAPLMVDAATKLIWTSYRDDAAKFAGSMQIRPEEILSLPQFTFGMYSRKRGFLPLRGKPNALAGFDRPEKGDDLRKLMEELYGPTAVDEGPDEPEPDGGLYDRGEPESGPPENSDQPDGDASGDDGADKDEGLGEPPDVEVI